MVKGVVSQVNVFKGLNRAQVKELTSWMEPVTFQKGEVIFKEGQRSTGLYLLCSGDVSIVKTGNKGLFKLAEVSAPSFFGEASLLINVKRTATVRALTKVEAALLPLMRFREQLNARSLTAFLVTLNISRLMAERVVETNRQVALAATRVKRKTREAFSFLWS